MKTPPRRAWYHWLALPWWALQLLTGAKSFRDNPLIGSKRLNHWGLYEARIRLAYKLAERRRRRLARTLDEAERAQFAKQGYILLHDFMPRDEFEALRSAILRRTSPVREMQQGNAITRRIAIDHKMMRDVPAVRQLLKHPRWSRLMHYVAGFKVEPLYYVQTILSHKKGRGEDPQNFLHADTFHPTMKAWFFLTDVAQEDGPLTYVAGSHKLTPERLEWERGRALLAPEGVDRLSARGSMRIEPDELAKLGLSQPMQFTVPSNTLAVVDTFGFHARGRAARPSVRMEIWAYSRRNPFIPWLGFDLLSLPGIAERRIPILWSLRDRFKRWTGQPWKYVGDLTPDSND